jgi:hypothetical protein
MLNELIFFSQGRLDNRQIVLSQGEDLQAPHECCLLYRPGKIFLLDKLGGLDESA